MFLLVLLLRFLTIRMSPKMSKNECLTILYRNIRSLRCHYRQHHDLNISLLEHRDLKPKNDNAIRNMAQR